MPKRDRGRDQPPALLLAAFRATEQVYQVACLMVDDGWDAVSIRVLGAWASSDNRWTSPTTSVPDDGKPTPAAWEWLCSGWQLDVAGVAAGANVSMETARERLQLLQRSRCIYPSGEMNKWALAAVNACVASRVNQRGQGKGRPGRGGGGEDLGEDSGEPN